MKKFKKKIITFLLVVCMTVGVVVANCETVKAYSWQYTVQAGDTLWELATYHGTTVSAIRNASNIFTNIILPGQVLNIPSNTTTTSTNSTGSVNNLSQSERDLFARVIEGEAGGEPYVGKVGVAAVILNRVNSPKFPNTLKDVIYERHAFEAVTNNSIWRRNPSQDAYQALEQAMNGWDPTYDSLFFWNPYKPVNPWVWSRPIQVQYGEHVFAH